MQYSKVERNVEGDRCNMGHIDAFETVEHSANPALITDADSDKWNNVEVILKQYRTKPMLTRELDQEERYVINEEKEIAGGMKQAMERRADNVYLSACNIKGDYTAVGGQGGTGANAPSTVNLGFLLKLGEEASAANWERGYGLHPVWCTANTFYKIRAIPEVSSVDYHEKTWNGAAPFVMWDMFKFILNNELQVVGNGVGTTNDSAASTGELVGKPAATELLFAAEYKKSVGFAVGNNWRYTNVYESDWDSFWHMSKGRLGAKTRQPTGVLRAVVAR